MFCHQVSEATHKLFCLENILVRSTCQERSKKTFCEGRQFLKRKMSLNLCGDYVNAKLLEVPFKVEGEVVKGF